MHTTDTFLSFYKSAKDNYGYTGKISEAVDFVSGDSLINKTSQYRLMEDGESKDDYKKRSFTGVTWSGTFAPATTIRGAKNVEAFRDGKTNWKKLHEEGKIYERTRAAEQLMQHSGLICIDIDKIETEKLSDIKKMLAKDAYTFFLFTSPSGAGLKVIIKISYDEKKSDSHLSHFQALEKYFIEKYSIPVDTSGKDVSRLCFLCYDGYTNDSCYTNVNSDVFTITDTIPIPSAERKLSKPDSQKLRTLELNVNDVFEFTQNIASYTPHVPGTGYKTGRNNFIYQFASNCNRKGIALQECLSFALGLAEADKGKTEVTDAVNSAYKNHAGEFGKFKPKKSIQKNHLSSATVSTPNIHVQKKEEGKAEDLYIKFWSTYEIIDNRTKRSKTITDIDIFYFIEFLEQQGFFIYKVNKGYQFVRVIKNTVEVVDPVNISVYVTDFLRARGEIYAFRKILGGNKAYMAVDKYMGLSSVNILTKKDTATECFLYFKNCMVSITKDTITANEYRGEGFHIWKDVINKNDFVLKEREYINQEYFSRPDTWECEFARFIYYASYNPDNEEEKGLDILERMQRFCALCTSIGYLLHSYKHPAYRKGIFSIDHKISEENELCGRSGKSLIPQFCSHFKVVSTIGGKNYDPKYQFRYEPININTQIINYNDMEKYHDVQTEFEIIADDYSVNKRNTGFIHFKYEDSPKVYYSTNHVPKGRGDSYSGRMHVIEFSDFFNARHTPFDFFGHALFSGWDAEQWNEAYNFACWCVQLFLTEGLINYPNGNFSVRKLYKEVPEQFISWIDEKDDAGKYKNVRHNEWFRKKDLYEQWSKFADDEKIDWRKTARQFYTFITAYTSQYNIPFNRDKTGGIEYYFFGNPKTSKRDSVQAEINF